jgi:bifunctional ADP-heptose synthase (sugar kinase/adenylyltransferase)
MNEVDLIGVVGDDDYCNMFSALCKESNISFLPILSSAPTITKQRFIETTYQQQLLRVDYEKKFFMSPQDNESVISHLNQFAPDYIVISDYNKGMINQKLVDAIKKYSIDTQAKIFVDTKPASLEYFKDVYLIKPNFKEFCLMVSSPELENTDEAIK